MSELRVRYQLDPERVRAVHAHTIIIKNCGSPQANVLLLPDVALEDGNSDVAVLRPEGGIGWSQIAVKVFWESGVLQRGKVGRSPTGRRVRVPQPESIPAAARHDMGRKTGQRVRQRTEKEPAKASGESHQFEDRVCLPRLLDEGEHSLQDRVLG